jgi:hypothetical protein
MQLDEKFLEKFEKDRRLILEFCKLNNIGLEEMFSHAAGLIVLAYFHEGFPLELVKKLLEKPAAGLEMLWKGLKAEKENGTQ